MKKILLVLFTVFAIANAQAQSPIIKQFREIVQDAPNQFSKFQKEVINNIPEKQTIIYNSTVEDNAISKNYIIKTDGKSTTYMIKFDVENMQPMMMKMFTIISGQYITELNEMVKSGQYTGKDYNEGEDSVTELKDLKGNVAVKYASNAKNHYVIIYSPREAN